MRRTAAVVDIGRAAGMAYAGGSSGSLRPPAPQMPHRPDDWSETRAAFPVSAAGPQTFQAEQLVADRFRIVRFVAGGGMGQVYEAEDLELHQNLALKTIRPEIAQDERAIARFKREAFLARQVTHPNICRILISSCTGRRPWTAWPPPITFVTMQLLDGQSLPSGCGRGA